MFNSQKINNDPEPFVVSYQGVDAKRVSQPHAAQLPSHRYENGFGETVIVRYAERPEYDNNPNPILEYFRDAMQTGEYEMVALATLWVGLINSGYGWEGDGLDPSSEHLEHAAKVLERLANFGNN